MFFTLCEVLAFPVTPAVQFHYQYGFLWMINCVDPEQMASPIAS